MQCIVDLEDYQEACGTAITLGKFDGLHRGHQILLRKVRAYAEVESLKSVAFVFDMSVFYQKIKKEYQVLMTKEERRKQLEGRIDYLVECPFTDEIRTMEAEAFIRDILVGKFHAKRIVVGTDYFFGYQKRGNYRLLEQCQDKYGYQVEVVEKLWYIDREISSTYLREEVTAGRMNAVAKMLGHPYRILGTVEHGRKLGRKLGIPTMNVPISEEKLLPPNGVYAAQAHMNGIWYSGIANIGKKPTVEQNGAVLAEIHLFDFSGDAYGSQIEIDLYDFRRSEKKFNSVEELKSCMQKDIAYGKRYFCTAGKRTDDVE